MKIYEIIVEDKEKKLPKTLRVAGIHAKQFPTIDQNYGIYRFGLAMAGEPETSAPKAGPAKDVPCIWMYTDADEEIINKAAKNQGIKGKTLVSKGPSEELKSINTVSPVAKRKPNKYGV